MDSEASASPDISTAMPPARELSGSVIDVVGGLLADFAERDVVLEIVRKLVAENTDMARRLAQIATRFKKSEKVGKAQLVLFLDALQRGEGEPEVDAAREPDEVDAADGRLRATAGADELKRDDDLSALETRLPRDPAHVPAPAHLPRVDNPIAVPPEQRACPQCGRERVCIGHDITEVIELIPAKVIVRRDAREKLACPPCEGELVRAPLGDKAVPAGKLGLALVAQLLVDKYVDGLPLHRQRERFQRLGIDLSVSTLCDQVTWCTDLLRPLWRAALAEVIAARVMHLDGTGLPVLDSGVRGKTRLGTLWGYVGVNERETIAAYLFTSTGKKVAQQSGEMGPEDVLALREGPTVADASNLFDASFRRAALVECGCNMHGRRYFVKALDANDKRAALPIAGYRKLYKIEDEIRALDPEAKRAVRHERSRPVFESLANWCRVRKKYEPPATPLGKALQYFTNHEVALARFLDDGWVPIDNGIVERLHIRAALTRKNFLFAGSDAGGERAAIAYTIFGSCRLTGIDPIAYLADVLPKLTRRVRLLDVPALLPSRWAAARTVTTP
ncbi:MAG TPA: IS66 family transposase [Kofleriaceae bacterium]|nr:IS66 family transposase [Kofleriaceae bacterium]